MKSPVCEKEIGVGMNAQVIILFAGSEQKGVSATMSPEYFFQKLP
jgi:hypothetical protein